MTPAGEQHVPDRSGLTPAGSHHPLDGCKRAVSPSFLQLLAMAIGQWIGRRKLVAAFMLGLDAGCVDRCHYEVHGEWRA